LAALARGFSDRHFERGEGPGDEVARRGIGNRVWKRILGTRKLTKIRCGIRENAKDPDGIRDLTASREASFAKICAQDKGIFALLSGIREIVKTQINVLEAKAIQPGECKISIKRKSTPYIYELLQKLAFFECIFGKEKRDSG